MRILRWFVPGEQGRIKQEIGGTHILDADYVPESVHLSLQKAIKGTRPLRIDITVNGNSIFVQKPALVSDQADKVWTTIPEEVMREGSIVKLNIAQTGDIYPGEDLTVELLLRES